VAAVAQAARQPLPPESPTIQHTPIPEPVAEPLPPPPPVEPQAPPVEVAQAPPVEAAPPPPEEPVTSTWQAPTPVRESSPLESVSRNLGEFEQDDLDVPAFLRKRGENR